MKQVHLHKFVELLSTAAALVLQNKCLACGAGDPDFFRTNATAVYVTCPALYIEDTQTANDNPIILTMRALAIIIHV